jgi:hypothetical protein
LFLGVLEVFLLRFTNKRKCWEGAGGDTTEEFLTGTSKITYEKYGDDPGKMLGKGSNEVMTWLVKTGFNFELSCAHQESSASFQKTVVTVRCSMN